MPMNSREISIPLPGATLGGDLIIPDGATGLVIFAHGIDNFDFQAVITLVLHKIISIQAIDTFAVHGKPWPVF